MMHWENGWHDGPGGWGWLLMALMMLAFWGGVAWIITTVVRHGRTSTGPVGTAPVVSPAITGPEDILHERFARGEIDTEEYHHRLDAMRAKR